MPPGDDSLQAGIEQFRHLIDRHFGFAGRLRLIVLRLDGGHEIPLPVPAEAGDAADGLSPTQAAILAVLRAAPAPLKAITIAAKARAVHNKHFLAALLQLQRLNRVRKVTTKGEPPRYQLAR